MSAFGVGVVDAVAAAGDVRGMTGQFGHPSSQKGRTRPDPGLNVHPNSCPAAVATTAAWGAAAGLGSLTVPQATELHEPEGQGLSQYMVTEKLGEGTYGKVYKVVDKATGGIFALKKIKIVYEDEGVPSTAIREISLLKECDHVNVIKLYQVFSDTTALYLLFEHADMDLRAFLKRHGKFKDQISYKNAVGQCFCGIEFCHSHRILHRDLKPQNVLVDVANCRLKLADFGLARAFTVPLRPYTHEVVTLWYRAPEILLGVSVYATPTDIWSLGCIMAEMATAQALFPGDSEIDTIFKIFRVLGTPNESVWPGVETLRDYKKAFPKWPDTGCRDVQRAGPVIDADAMELLRACFQYNPVERPSARKALQHPFFDALYPASSAPIGGVSAEEFSAVYAGFDGESWGAAIAPGTGVRLPKDHVTAPMPGVHVAQSERKSDVAAELSEVVVHPAHETQVATEVSYTGGAALQAATELGQGCSSEPGLPDRCMMRI